MHSPHPHLGHSTQFSFCIREAPHSGQFFIVAFAIGCHLPFCQSHWRFPATWYSVTLVSKKFFSLLKSTDCDIHGKGFSLLNIFFRPILSSLLSAICST